MAVVRAALSRPSPPAVEMLRWRHQACCYGGQVKLWVDDHRPAPRGWRAVRSVAAAKVYLEQGLVTDISLDHDMGACRTCSAAGLHIGRMTRRANTFYDYCPHVPSGYDLCVWMEQTGRWPRSSVRVHSANPVGARRMLAVIGRAGRGSAGLVTPGPATTWLGGWIRMLARAWSQIGAVLDRNRTSAKS